ncbi:Condensin-2 complex subunit D3 [Portunus trituberculatus]|uniref:Condensin-2 complex subunit D3 n=1 Tax=Portunus trituberculatus TaxID=210409 RepID=A0A5B7EL11_PORTR|nr:Condensin-2 complex subunit D3 [Portunus trituberculatus]
MNEIVDIEDKQQTGDWRTLLYTNGDNQKAVEKWVAPILKACDEHLKEVLFLRTDTLDAAGEERLYRYLFTMGEAAMLCPHKVNKRMFLMLQSLIFHQQGQEKDDSLLTVPSTQTQCSQPTTITFTPTIRLKMYQSPTF